MNNAGKFLYTKSVHNEIVDAVKNLEKHILKSLDNGKKKLSKKELEDYIVDQRQKLNIQRFKGLGEMNPEELWSTTLDPDNRNLLQVKYSRDQKKDQEIIHTLMGNDVSIRKEFIISNAIDINNLDV